MSRGCARSILPHQEPVHKQPCPFIREHHRHVRIIPSERLIHIISHQLQKTLHSRIHLQWAKIRLNKRKVKINQKIFNCNWAEIYRIKELENKNFAVCGWAGFFIFKMNDNSKYNIKTVLRQIINVYGDLCN